MKTFTRLKAQGLLLGATFLIATVAGATTPVVDAVKATRDGKVRFECNAREGVYGRGDGWIFETASGTSVHHGHHGRMDADPGCSPCRIRVTLYVRDGEIIRLRTSFVSGRSSPPPRNVEDLGEVAPEIAAPFLLHLALDGEGRVSEEALKAAVIAEPGVPWRNLLELAQDPDRSRGLRRTAIFWLGQEAAEVVTQELEGFVTDPLEDLEVRKQAVFALSQHPDSQCIPALERIIRTHRSAEIRSTALFWLAEKEDPEVVEFLEMILSGGL